MSSVISFAYFTHFSNLNISRTKRDNVIQLTNQGGKFDHGTTLNTGGIDK